MRDDAVERATDALLVRGLLPAWLGAGVLDWCWHRQTRIAENAGSTESAMHLLMGIEAGAAISVALFCEANKTSVLAAFGAALIHELTTMADVAYAVPRREVKPRENYTHSFLEVLPFVVSGLIAIRPHAEREGLRLRRRFPPLTTVLGVYASAALFGLAPHLEELIRCLRHEVALRRGGNAP
jgi:hypothetical protein